MDGKGKQKMMAVMGRRGDVKKEEYANSSSGDDEYEYGYHQKMGPLEDVDLVCNKKRVVTSSTGGGGGRGSSGGGGGMLKCCQADKCSADMSDSKPYHKRHKVCEPHAKAEVVVVGGIRQRFCQQCSRFHELSEFDDTKRSCLRRLAGHNERRRKSISAKSHSEGPTLEMTSYQLDDNACGNADYRERIKITIHGKVTYKHFQIR